MDSALFDTSRTGRRPGGPTIPGYRFFESIGRGGFSTVYRAEQVSLGRDVAIKVIDADFRDEEAVRKFQRECRTTGKLTHENHVINVFDAGSTDQEQPYIVMQYLPGGSVADRLRAGGPLTVRDSLRIGARVAEALAAAHGAGILHRDIKPGNILLDERDEPVVSDFGIAALSNAEITSVAFTAAYAPPEVLKNQMPGAHSDIYSLGATLYSMLAGHAPFGPLPSDSGDYIVYERALNDPIPPIDRSDLPGEIEDLVRSLLTRDVSGRPDDAGLVAQQLWLLHDRLDGGTDPDEQSVEDDDSIWAPHPQSLQAPWPGPRESPPLSGGGPTRGRVVDRDASRPLPSPEPPSPAEESDGRLYSSLDVQGPTRLRQRQNSAEPDQHRGRPVGATGLVADDRRSRWWMITAGVVCAIVVLIVTAALIAPKRHPAGTTATTTRPTATPTSRAAQLAAAQPYSLKAVDHGASVTLTWRDGSAATPLVIQPQSQGRPAAVTSLPAGTVRYDVDELDPDTPYCFSVGAILAVNEIAWSQPACIRGAVAVRPGAATPVPTTTVK